MTAPRFELMSQRQKFSRLPTKPPGLPVLVILLIQLLVKIEAVVSVLDKEYVFPAWAETYYLLYSESMYVCMYVCMYGHHI